MAQLDVDSASLLQTRFPNLHEKSYVESLWNGVDVDAIRRKSSLSLLDASPSLNSSQSQMAGDHGATSVQLLGPPDSGTNLWVKMVQLNWPDRVSTDAGALDHFIWKHSINNADEIKHTIESKLPDLSKSVLIISIRSPISQMASWKNNPYSLAPCFVRRISEWNRSCFSNTGADHHDDINSVAINIKDALSNHFSSSMDVYNQYVRQYLDLEKLGGFKTVMLVPYEDMVLTPEIVLERFANAAGWPIPQHGFQIFGDPAKHESVSHGREMAILQLRTRPWLLEYVDALPMLCEGLDQEQIKRFSEGMYTSTPRPYAQDCHI